MSGFGLGLGAVLLTLTTTAAYDTARRLAWRLGAAGRLEALAWTLLGATSFVVVLVEILGLAGGLQEGYVAGASAAAWGVTFYADRRWPRQGSAQVPPPADRAPWRSPLLLTAAGGLSVLLLAWMLTAVIHPRPEYDAIAAHLPIPVQWAQAGNLRFLPYIAPVAFPAHYPANAEILALWLQLPVGRDFLVQLASLPGVAMLVVGVGMTARELGARRVAALAAALLVPTMPRPLTEMVGTNMQDMLSVGATMMLAAMVARDRNHRSRANLAFAGLALGLAVGTRYAALLTVAPLVALLAVQRLWPRANRTGLAAGAGLLLAGALATGGLWYARNLLATGDPIYPQSLPWHGVDAVEKLVFPVIRSYLSLGWDPAAWASALGAAWRQDGPIFLLLAVAALVPLFVGVASNRTGVAEWGWRLLPATTLAVTLATPGVAGYVVSGRLVTEIQAAALRYLLPALAIAAAVGAAAATRLRPRVEAAGAALLLLLALGSSALVIAQQVPVWRRQSVPALGVSALLVAVAVAAARRRAPRAVYVAAAGLALIAVGLGAPALAAHYDAQRLAEAMPLEATRLRLGNGYSSIAVAGFCDMYALYGPDWSRRVEYLTGRDQVLDRPLAAGYDEWVASLRAHHATALVVSADSCFVGVPVPQRMWAATHPEVFREFYSDREAIVYTVAGS